MKQGRIDGKIQQKIRSIGSQPARFYVLENTHKENTPLLPALSICGSSCDQLKFVREALQPALRQLYSSKLAADIPGVCNEKFINGSDGIY